MRAADGQSRCFSFLGAIGFFEVFNLLQYGPDGIPEASSVLGQFYAPADSGMEFCAALLFEQPQLFGNGRLTDADFPGGFRRIEVLGDNLKDFKLVQSHSVAFFFARRTESLPRETLARFLTGNNNQKSI